MENLWPDSVSDGMQQTITIKLKILMYIFQLGKDISSKLAISNQLTYF